MLIKYMKSKIICILYYLVLGILYLFFAVLFHEPTLVVVYPFLIGIFTGIIFFAIDYKRTRDKLLILEEEEDSGNYILEDLPEGGILTNRYKEMYEKCVESSKEKIFQYENDYKESIDYFTLWAHQVKTPIASMRLMLDNEDSDEARKLSLELFKIEQYVEMVMNYMRLGSDSTDYVIRECSLDDIIKGTIKKYAGEFIQRKIKLEYEEIEVNTLTDEKWLSFAVEQIISNALKYTKNGKVAIYYKNEELVIEDTGMGISASDLPRVFEKGYTGNIGREDKRASGIGLFLVKQILDKLGHKIRIESTQGQGTKVYLDTKSVKLWTE